MRVHTIHTSKIFIALALSMLLSCKAGITTYPIPEGEEIFIDYKLQINKKLVSVYPCRVSAVPFNQVWNGFQRPVEQTEIAGFAYWDMKDSVDIQISAMQPIDNVVIRPLSLGINPVIKENKISFTLDSIIPIVIEVNGYHKALHLFPNPELKEIPKTRTAHLHYFGPGIHDVGILHLQSNDSVFIAGGAVVYGTFLASEADNIHIWGRGILDGSRIKRSNLPYIGPGCITIFGSSNIHIEGIILRDPNRWCLNLFGCKMANIYNVKLIGLWRYNTDGISVSNSQNVLVENCFVRSYDDAIEVKGVKGWDTKSLQNVRFNRCVLWCDWGRSMSVTSETCAPRIENVIFENSNLIHTTHNAMGISHIDRAEIRNIRFENVNVELNEWNPRPMLQKSKDIQYSFNLKDNYCPGLFSISIYKHSYSQDRQNGNIDSVLFKNISVYGNTNCHSGFVGLDDKYDVNNVLIKNLQFNGKIIDNIKQANLTIGPFVSGIRIEK